MDHSRIRPTRRLVAAGATILTVAATLAVVAWVSPGPSPTPMAVTSLSGAGTGATLPADALAPPGDAAAAAMPAPVVPETATTATTEAAAVKAVPAPAPLPLATDREPAPTPPPGNCPPCADVCTQPAPQPQPQPDPALGFGTAPSVVPTSGPASPPQPTCPPPPCLNDAGSDGSSGSSCPPAMCPGAAGAGVPHPASPVVVPAAVRRAGVALDGRLPGVGPRPQPPCPSASQTDQPCSPPCGKPAGTDQGSFAPCPAGSGVEGIVHAGPTCPVEREDQPCPDRPVQTTLRLVRSDGSVAATGKSDENGKFHFAAPAGQYRSWWPTTARAWAAPGGCPPVDVVIEPDRYSYADVSCDSGIR